MKTVSVFRTTNKDKVYDNEVLISNFPLEKSDTWLAESKENDFPQDYGIFVMHFRGQSVHLDFRRMKNGYLDDDAIMIQPEGLITEDVDTVAKGRKWTDILISKGKFRPDMDPNSRAVMVLQEKHPVEWVGARDVAFAPGSPGATKYEPGVMITMDEGMAWPGVRMPNFKEFFLDMKLFKKQRMVERIIEIPQTWDQPAAQTQQWQTWLPEDQVPYILSKRQRKDRRDYIPADGESAIPPWWREKIPTAMAWWSEKGMGQELSDKEKMDKLDAAYNYLISKGEPLGQELAESIPYSCDTFIKFANSSILDLSNSNFPLEVKFSDAIYKLLRTKNGGLVLNKD